MSVEAVVATRIELFGSLRLVRNEEPPRSFRSHRAMSLMAYLALHAGQRQQRERLAERFWPDMDLASARNNFNSALVTLRQEIEGIGISSADLLAIDRFTLTLCTDHVVIDTLEFERLLKRAKSSALATERAPLREQAVALYRGHLLEDWQEEWVLSAQTAYKSQYQQTLLDWMRDLEELQEWEAAQKAAEKAVATDPLHEEATCELMRLLAQQGHTARALDTYRHYEQRLREELDAEPTQQLRQLKTLLQKNPDAFYNTSSRPTPGTSATMPLPSCTTEQDRQQKPVSNLPVTLDAFFGRDALQREVEALLEQGPLVTLHGMGGCGKTRLAIEIGRSLQPRFAGEIWLLRLEALEHPDFIEAEMAKMLGLNVTPARSCLETLVETLRERKTLLILDNCEHLVAGCAELAKALLSACPHLRILATSRQPLHLHGEQVREVTPLSLPEKVTFDTPAALERFEQSEAVQLFLARARASAGFKPTLQNSLAVATICRTLDGIPLPLELAAHWVDTLTVEQIAEELGELINTPQEGTENLLPSRHQTMHATVDWSYSRLPPTEQRLFRALAIFAGGFTLEAARAMAGTTVSEGGTRTVPASKIQTLLLLKSLVDRSLVTFDAEAQPEPRYRLLEPVREVAAGLLASTNEEIEARSRHRDWCLAYAREGAEHLTGPHQPQWLDRLEADHNNFRTALRSSCAPDAQLAMAIALGRFWRTRGYSREGIKHLQKALLGTTNPLRRLEGLNILGVLHWNVANFQEAGSCFREVLALFRKQNDSMGIAKALNNIALIERNLGNLTEAETLLQECLTIYEQANDTARSATVLSNLGMLAYDQAEYECAVSYLVQAIERYEISGNLLDLSSALHFLGIVRYKKTDYKKALEAFHASLEMRTTLKDRIGQIATIYGMATTFFALNETQKAIMAYATTERARKESPDYVDLEEERNIYDSEIQKLRARTSPEAFRNWWIAGERTTCDDWVTIGA